MQSDSDIDASLLKIIRSNLKGDRNTPMPPPIEPFVNNKKEIGRNDACPCGSGLKFKKCCVDNVTVYTVTVRHRGVSDFHCKIRLTDQEDLHGLHGMIQSAFGWDNDHMYSFMLDNKYPNSKRELSANPLGEGNTVIPLQRLNLEEGMKFLYLFDYGDQHLFDVVVDGVTEVKSQQIPRGRWIEKFGTPPEQYETWDE